MLDRVRVARGAGKSAAGLVVFAVLAVASGRAGAADLFDESVRAQILKHNDGRVFLNRHKESYDLILLDAYREFGVPFHLLTREFYELVKARLAPGGAVASNVSGNTLLFRSTLATFCAVFATVDVDPDWKQPDEAQAVVVATPSARPDTEALMQRATALQAQHHFRYPLSEVVGKRVIDGDAGNGQVLTDDFAPVNLYETIPLRAQQRE